MIRLIFFSQHVPIHDVCSLKNIFTFYVVLLFLHNIVVLLSSFKNPFCVRNKIFLTKNISLFIFLPQYRNCLVYSTIISCEKLSNERLTIIVHNLYTQNTPVMERSTMNKNVQVTYGWIVRIYYTVVMNPSMVRETNRYTEFTTGSVHVLEDIYRL